MADVLPGDLTYVSDTDPGIRRKKTSSGFRYEDSDGKPVRDPHALLRIKALAIPPAWTDVWISSVREGHLQARGRDAKGRKQYRYHVRWREVRDSAKYERAIAFGQALPALRERVQHDLSLSGLSREKVLATVVRLLELTLIRVGNEEYRRSNNSFGLTTLRNRHVAVNGGGLKFEFRGKSGKQHSIGVRDRRLARIVKQCQEIKGQQLFQYLDENGDRHQVTSGDVNAYLREAMGEDFTAKDFRTWAGTVLAASALQLMESGTTQTEAKRNLAEVVEEVARRLGNTAAICRKCYIHPDVVEAYLEGDLAAALKGSSRTKPVLGLSPEEQAVLQLLRRIRPRAKSSRGPTSQPKSQAS